MNSMKHQSKKKSPAFKQGNSSDKKDVDAQRHPEEQIPKPFEVSKKEPKNAVDKSRHH